jgi:hypothetical protein
MPAGRPKDPETTEARCRAIDLRARGSHPADGTARPPLNATQQPPNNREEVSVGSRVRFLQPVTTAERAGEGRLGRVEMKNPRKIRG